MRIVTTTQENGKVIGKGGNKQRTVAGTPKDTDAHADAVEALIRAHNLNPDLDKITCETTDLTPLRMVWEV